MTMMVLTFFQMLGILTAYSLMVYILPALLLKGRLKSFVFSERMMIYVLLGNCFMMNSVFVLQLLHLSGVWSMRLLTVLLLCLGIVGWHREGARRVLLGIIGNIQRLLTGTMGYRTFWRRGRDELKRLVIKGGGSRKDGKERPAAVSEGLCFILLVLVILYFLGADLLRSFGYRFSDLVLHNKWINELSRQNLFADGVYPFGYHTVIYYLHTVFGFDTVVLLRLFGVVQGLYIGLMLWAFLRSVCRTVFVAYGAPVAFLGLSVWSVYMMERYTAPLPQEFGLIFLFPGIYFLIAYLLREEDRRRCLLFFGLGVSMTFSVHFYVTLIAGLGCMAAAGVFLPQLLRGKRFWPLAAACLLSFALAAYPMAAALAGGTPMQGSMEWAIGIIRGEDTAGEDTESREEAASDGTEMEAQSTAAEGDGGSGPASASEGETIRAHALQIVRDAIGSSLFETKYAARYSLLASVILCVIAAGLLLGLAGLLVDRVYAQRLLAISVFQCFLLLLLSAGELGLPTLMDDYRARAFFHYGLALQAGLTLDALLYMTIGRKKRLPAYIASLGLLLAGLVLAWTGGLIRGPLQKEPLEKNGAAICFFNIVNSREPFTWTIVSPNDEHQMGVGRGYHMETVDFLRNMEPYRSDSAVLIPTEYVYIFVEKRPLDYYLTYEGSGQEVSEEGAARPIPQAGGIYVYFTENRWILMSKMFYWSREFQRIYPNEMKVYYEDEEFVCYEIRQNTFSTFNFAVDYQFNRMAGGG